MTAGGRVLNAVGSGPDLAAARAAAYASPSVRAVLVPRDIARAPPD